MTISWGDKHELPKPQLRFLTVEECEEISKRHPAHTKNTVYVDDWVSRPSLPSDPEGEKYAKFFFLHKRLPAHMQFAFRKWMEPHKLFCDFDGKTWRVTGASRMGDIWLAIDHRRVDGYDLRRYVNECTNWRAEP